MTLDTTSKAFTGRTITFVVEGQATAKGRARATAQGHHYTPAKTRNAEAFVRARAADAMAGQPLLGGPLRLAMQVVCPIPSSWSRKKQEAALLGALLPTGRPDLDNLEKLATDAMNTVVYADDAAICRKASEKRYGLQAMTVITVTELQPQVTA